MVVLSGNEIGLKRGENPSSTQFSRWNFYSWKRLKVVTVNDPFYFFFTPIYRIRLFKPSLHSKFVRMGLSICEY